MLKNKRKNNRAPGLERGCKRETNDHRHISCFSSTVKCYISEYHLAKGDPECSNLSLVKLSSV